MRLRRVPAIAALSVLAWAATASAAWAWILWSQGVRQDAHNLVRGESVSVIERLQNALQEAAVRLQKSDHDLVDTAESITAIKDDDNFTGLTCLPDTVDPRRAERRTLMSKRSYRYRGYYIEVAVQEVGVKHFEGAAAIFGSPESARSGQSPVHRCARMGRTPEEADRAAVASAESWAKGPGKRA